MNLITLLPLALCANDVNIENNWKMLLLMLDYVESYFSWIIYVKTSKEMRSSFLRMTMQDGLLRSTKGGFGTWGRVDAASQGVCASFHPLSIMTRAKMYSALKLIEIDSRSYFICIKLKGM